jgi:hypothetical protein
MQLHDRRTGVTATVIIGALACEHRTEVDRQVALGLLDPSARPAGRDGRRSPVCGGRR